MNKKLIGSYKGKIVNKYLPKVYDGYQFADEEKIDIIGLDAKINDKVIKLIKPRYSKYADLLVDDEVIVNKYKLIEPYEDHIKSIKEYINNYYSEKTEEEKEKIFEKNYLSKEEFNKKPRALIDYEIVFE